MVKNQRSSTYGFSPYGATSNAADAAKIFKLGADSTPVEWRLDAYDNGETRQFVVGTDQEIDRVGNGKKEADRLKVKGNRVIDIHSHPSDETQGASKEDQASIKAKKNAVYFKRDATLHEYDASDANLNERKINTYLDLEQYISSK